MKITPIQTRDTPTKDETAPEDFKMETTPNFCETLPGYKRRGEQRSGEGRGEEGGRGEGRGGEDRGEQGTGKERISTTKLV